MPGESSTGGTGSQIFVQILSLPLAILFRDGNLTAILLPFSLPSGGFVKAPETFFDALRILLEIRPTIPITIALPGHVLTVHLSRKAFVASPARD